VLFDGSVTHLVHFVELDLEKGEVTTGLRFSVDHTFLELLEGVNNLEEVSVIEEKVKVFGCGLLYDGFNRDV